MLLRLFEPLLAARPRLGNPLDYGGSMAFATHESVKLDKSERPLPFGNGRVPRRPEKAYMR